MNSQSLEGDVVFMPNYVLRLVKLRFVTIGKFEKTAGLMVLV